MDRRFIEWIWHIRGSLELPSGQSNDELFDRLDPLFRQTGTSRERTNDTLTFRKQNPAAQDKMSIFNSGVLRIEAEAGGSVLRYRLASRTLLACFLAPLIFLALAQLTVIVGKLEEPTTAEEKAAAKAAEAKKKAATEKLAKMPLHPIDQALGAPAPEKPKEDKKEGKHSPTAAYVFAALFALLYLVGRILEDRLVKALFRRCLSDEQRLPSALPSRQSAPAAERTPPTAIA